MFTATCRRGSMEFLTVRQLGKLCAIKWRNPAACIEHPKFILFVFVGKLGYNFFYSNIRWVRSAEIKKGHFKNFILKLGLAGP